MIAWGRIFYKSMTFPCLLMIVLAPVPLVLINSEWLFNGRGFYTGFDADAYLGYFLNYRSHIGIFEYLPKIARLSHILPGALLFSKFSSLVAYFIFTFLFNFTVPAVCMFFLLRRACTHFVAATGVLLFIFYPFWHQAKQWNYHNGTSLSYFLLYLLSLFSCSTSKKKFFFILAGIFAGAAIEANLLLAVLIPYPLWYSFNQNIMRPSKKTWKDKFSFSLIHLGWVGVGGVILFGMTGAIHFFSKPHANLSDGFIYLRQISYTFGYIENIKSKVLSNTVQASDFWRGRNMAVVFPFLVFMLCTVVCIKAKLNSIESKTNIFLQKTSLNHIKFFIFNFFFTLGTLGFFHLMHYTILDLHSMAYIIPNMFIALGGALEVLVGSKCSFIKTRKNILMALMLLITILTLSLALSSYFTEMALLVRSRIRFPKVLPSSVFLSLAFLFLLWGWKNDLRKHSQVGWGIAGGFLSSYFLANSLAVTNPSHFSESLNFSYHPTSLCQEKRMSFKAYTVLNNYFKKMDPSLFYYFWWDQNEILVTSSCEPLRAPDFFSGLAVVIGGVGGLGGEPWWEATQPIESAMTAASIQKISGHGRVALLSFFDLTQKLESFKRKVAGLGHRAAEIDAQEFEFGTLKIYVNLLQVD